MERGLGERASRWVVSFYGSHVEVQRAVDHLGRVGYGRTALQGAASGAPVGILFGLFSLIDPLVPALILALYGLVFGAVLEAIVALISHALSGGRRDFFSVGGMEADHYNVVTDEEVAEEDRRLLSELR